MASLASASPYVVVTTQYPTNYGCHRGKRWSRAEAICSGYYELSCSCEYPTEAAAIEAAADERNQHDHFEDSEELWEANPLPPFNSGSLGNYDNDEEVKIEVMTPDEYSQRVAGDETCLINARKHAMQLDKAKREHEKKQLAKSGRCHYHYPKRNGMVDIPAQLELVEPPTKTKASKKRKKDEKEQPKDDGPADPLPAAFAKFTADCLDVNNPTDLATLTSLRYVMCADNKANEMTADTDPFLIILSQCLALEELHFDVNQSHRSSRITDEDYIQTILIKAPHLVKKLKVLSFQGGDLYPETIAELGRFTRLERLDIGDRFSLECGCDVNPYDDEPHPYDLELLQCIKGLPFLQRLDLGYGGDMQRYCFDYCLSPAGFASVKDHLECTNSLGCEVTMSQSREPHVLATVDNK